MDTQKYMVDVDRAILDKGIYIGKGDPDYTPCNTLEEAQRKYAELVEYWKIQPDRPRIVSLSVRDDKYDTWDAISVEVVE